MTNLSIAKSKFQTLNFNLHSHAKKTNSAVVILYNSNGIINRKKKQRTYQ